MVNDFDWPRCAPGMHAEFRERGGDPTVPAQQVAAALRDELAAIWARRIFDQERENPMNNPMNPDSIIPLGVRPDTCRWEKLEEWATRTEAVILKPVLECAACHRDTPITEAHTTVAIGVHGDDLPIPGYIHCGSCMLRMQATEAWLLAHAEAAQIIGRRD